MTTATLPTAPAPPHLPHPYRWTVDEFHELKYRNTVWEGRKIILVDGELLEMPPPGPPHNSALGLAGIQFPRVFAQGYWVRIRMPLVFGINTDPLPDLAVVPGDPRTVTVNPASAVLVLEVSDSTLAYDTGEKASLYAAAGIADYWVIDVSGRRVLVHRDPRPDPAQNYGHGYRSVTVLLPGQALAPLAAPQAAAAAADLLP